MGLVYLKRRLLTNAVCTEHISVLLNVIAVVFRLKIFSVLQMLSTLMHISYFSKIRRLQKMTNEIKEFRDGIFALRTRRFGTVAELMIEALYSFSKSHNQFHDRYDEVGHQRIEIKFSTVMKANEAVISRSNSIDQCKKANLGNRALNSTEMYDYDFDCNIQQVKRLEFDVLYYGLFFADRIAIFKMYSNEILSCLGYSDKQHKGNEGEGQFHLNRSSIDYHMKNHFVQWLTYEELYNLLSNL